MNALEQLKSIAVSVDTADNRFEKFQWRTREEAADAFVASYGPALVELIEAAQKIANGAHPWMETSVKLRFELFAAVGKLTEDKPG